MITNEQKTQAVRYMETLSKVLDLDTFLLSELKKGKVLCSRPLPTIGANWVTHVEKDECIWPLLKEMQDESNVYIYHVIDAGDMISMLCVSPYPEEWYPLEQNNPMYGVFAAVYNKVYKFWEYGTVGVFNFSGSLMRFW